MTKSIKKEVADYGSSNKRRNTRVEQVIGT